MYSLEDKENFRRLCHKKVRGGGVVVAVRRRRRTTMTMMIVVVVSDIYIQLLGKL